MKVNMKAVKKVAVGVGLTLLSTSPAWAVTGLITDVKNTTDLASYIPGLITYGMFGVGSLGGLVMVHYIHKKGEHEAQGRPVTMKHILFPGLAMAAGFATPWLTGSAQKTFFNDTTATKATVGTTSQSVSIP
jgi:hypothetical protein